MAWLSIPTLLVVGVVGMVGLSRYSAPTVFGDSIRRVDTQDRVLALTFDDGPRDPSTRDLLAVLARHDVRATFFMTGEQADKHPELVRAVAAAGHQIGNHSWSHPRFVFQFPSFARGELDRTDEAIRRGGYEGALAFRSPYGKKGLGLQWVLSATDRPNILFDVMPTDYLRPGVAEIVSQVREEIEPGSIVVLHDGGGDRSQTVEAVDQLIPLLRRDGWTLSTVEEMLLARD